MVNTQDLASWGVFGGCVHALALGIRQKSLTKSPIGYAVSIAAFTSIGYIMDGVRSRQQDLIARRTDLLLQQREARGVKFARSD